jgi:hypothetical protein
MYIVKHLAPFVPSPLVWREHVDQLSIMQVLVQKKKGLVVWPPVR